MHDPRCTPPEEAALEHLLQASLPELPPAEIAQGVTPWRRAMDRILWGLALTSITLQFWNLQYLLPTIGLVLLMLGFRALRRENGWLAGCFVLAAFRLACTCFLLVINAALYREVFYALPWNPLSVRLFFYAVQLLQLFYHLVQYVLIAVDDNRHARNILILCCAGYDGVYIIPSSAEQTGNPSENARLILHQGI